MKSFFQNLAALIGGCLLMVMFFLLLNRVDQNKMIREAINEDPEAQYVLAKAYIGGEHGLPEDPVRGAKWLQKAAQHDYLPAIHLLADMYLRGEGVDRSKGKYLLLHLQASNLLNSKSRTIVGRAMLTGDGMEINQKAALNYLNKAANDQYTEAMIYLGQVYMEGVYAPCDREKAKEYFQGAKNLADKGADPWLESLARGDGCKMPEDPKMTPVPEGALPSIDSLVTTDLPEVETDQPKQEGKEQTEKSPAEKSPAEKDKEEKDRGSP